MGRWKENIFAFILITFFGLISYSNSFYNSFVFDDNTSIVYNKNIQNLATPGLLLESGRSRLHTNLSYALNYHFFGLNSVSYHAINFILHLLTAFTVFWLVRITLKSVWSDKRHFLFPLIVSLFFITHPIQTQAVSYIAQRSTLLAALFYLLTLSFYLKWVNSSINRKSNLITYLLSLFFFILALLSKENAYSLPFAILLVDYFFISKNAKRDRNRQVIYLPYFLIAVIAYLVLRTDILTNPNADLKQLFSVPSFVDEETIGRGSYLLTQFNVVATYIRLLILPFNQNLDYDYKITSTFNLPTLLFLLLHLSLIFISLRLRSGQAFIVYRRQRLISFGILFFYLTLFLESSIFPLPDLINEHRLYLPSIGLFLVLASLLFLFKPLVRRFLFFFLIVVIITSYSVATYNRNLVWQNNFTLWSDVVKKSPKKARAHFNLGGALVKRGYIKEGISEFKVAKDLDPKFEKAYFLIKSLLEKKN